MNDSTKPPVLNGTTITIIWLVLLAAITLMFNHILDGINNPNQQLKIENNHLGESSVTLQRNRYGHYVASGLVNDQPVVFFVDTGATLVAIPEHIARQIGLKKGASFQSETANGLSTSYQTTIEKLQLGSIVMHNVPASISSGMEFDEILLGMSFLKHLQIIQNGKNLTLSAP